MYPKKHFLYFKLEKKTITVNLCPVHLLLVVGEPGVRLTALLLVDHRDFQT